MLQISRTDGRHCLRALVMALLAALLLALTLQADAYAEGTEVPEIQEAGPAAPPETPQPEGEGGGEAAGQEVPEVGGVGGEVSGIGGETVPETPVSEPAEEAPVTPPSEVAEEAPGGAVAAEGSESAAGSGPAEAPEEPGGAKAASSSEEANAGAGGSLLRSSTLPSEETAPRAGAGASEETGAAIAATVTAQVSEITGQADSSEGEPANGVGTTARSQAGRFSCELSALGGDMTDNCTAGWLGSPRERLAAPTSAMVAAVSSLDPDPMANAPGTDGHGSSTVSGPPLTPAPGPAPGGTSGAATGAGGGAPPTGVSIFLTLAGLLLLGAPRAMRRLGLSFEPWLAGCFVLIPEHPD
jgi:hypothetical protein